MQDSTALRLARLLGRLASALEACELEEHDHGHVAHAGPLAAAFAASRRDSWDRAVADPRALLARALAELENEVLR